MDDFMKKKTISSAEIRKNAAKTFITPISQAELACRIAEAVLDMKRPDGDTAEQALDRMDDDARAQWIGAADAAMGYFEECIMNATEPH